MADPKSTPNKAVRAFDAPLASQIDGLHFVEQPKADLDLSEIRSADIQPPEPALVSKLINFIKKI